MRPSARIPAPGLDKSVAYIVLSNPTDNPQTIVGASSECCRSIEIHETRQVDGLMQMRRLKQLLIPPNDELALKPGGKHLMLFGVDGTVQVGDQFEISFTTTDGKSFSRSFEWVGLDAVL